MSSVRFTALGGVGEVGASCFLLELDGLHVLLDCGMHPKKEGWDSVPEFSRLERSPDAVIISHAHIDHCGSTPHLLKLHPSTVPYATAPTLKIMDRMLHNSVSVMNILRKERGIEEYPIYEHEDVDAALRRAYGIDMDNEFGLLPDHPARVRFSSAGHVLGSASVLLTTEGHRIFYTSDICTVDQELMQGFMPPDAANDIDTLIIETTYGADAAADDYDYTEEVERFGKDIVEVLVSNGTALVPSFALGRTQEILNVIARLQEEGKIPDVKVYASGLGRAVYEVYNRFVDHLKPDAELRPLKQFSRVGDVWDPQVVKELTSKPCIIVATSGMMIENTPSAVLAQQLVQDERHGIFFVGYCDPDTLGHKVRYAVPGDTLTFIRGGAPVQVRNERIRRYHFSAHAPRKALRNVVEHFNAKNIVFVHGDPPAIDWMYDNCGDGCTKFKPVIGETLELDS